MMDAVPPTHKTYINTTLPVSRRQPEEPVLDFIERNQRKIRCVDVSRRLQGYVEESNNELLKKLPVKRKSSRCCQLLFSASFIAGRACCIGAVLSPLEILDPRADFKMIFYDPQIQFR